MYGSTDSHTALAKISAMKDKIKNELVNKKVTLQDDSMIQ